MPNIIFRSAILTIAALTGLCTYADDTTTPAPAIYNAELASQLGADEYGMRSYVMVILETGPEDAVITDKEKRNELFTGHFANMARLAKAGKLALAGPFIDGAPKRGLYVFSVDTLEEAESLVKTDPTVVAGIFTYQLTQLYASAALMQVNEIHSTIQKNPVN